MRFFAAIVPPPAVVDALAAELASTSQPSAPGLRWTTTRSWHLTLAFYGEDDAERRRSMLERQLAPHGPLRLEITGAGTFSGVLWAGVGGDVDGLAAVARAVRSVDDGKPFHPHLTLARWRGSRRPDAVGGALRDLETYRGLPWTATEVVLMSSDLGHGPPRYTVRSAFRLSG